MIFEYVILAITTIINFVLGLLPTLPPMPTVVTDATTFLLGIIENASGALSYLYSETLFDAIIVMMIALFTFEYLYHMIMWLIRKIPLSIH